MRHQVVKKPPSRTASESKTHLHKGLVKSLLLFYAPDSLLALRDTVLQEQLQRSPLGMFHHMKVTFTILLVRLMDRFRILEPNFPVEEKQNC